MAITSLFSLKSPTQVVSAAAKSLAATAPGGDFLAAAIKSLTSLGEGTSRATMQGSSGNDRIALSADAGALSLGGGNDMVRGTGTVSGLIDLGAGADHYDGRRIIALSVVEGGAGNDILWGHARVGTTLSGGLGNDMLRGGAGHDMLSGGAGRDQMFAGAGHDTLSGGDGNDILRGEAGNDDLSGGTGDDYLFGGAGNDILRGGAGNDRLHSGTGADTFIFAAGDGRDVILDFDTANDFLRIEGLGSEAEVRAAARAYGDDLVFNFGSGERLVLKDVALDDLDGLLIG